jgi:hypothetical protein
VVGLGRFNDTTKKCFYSIFIHPLPKALLKQSIPFVKLNQSHYYFSWPNYTTISPRGVLVRTVSLSWFYIRSRSGLVLILHQLNCTCHFTEHTLKASYPCDTFRHCNIFLILLNEFCLFLPEIDSIIFFRLKSIFHNGVTVHLLRAGCVFKRFSVLGNMKWIECF